MPLTAAHNVGHGNLDFRESVEDIYRVDATSAYPSVPEFFRLFSLILQIARMHVGRDLCTYHLRNLA